MEGLKYSIRFTYANTKFASLWYAYRQFLKAWSQIKKTFMQTIDRMQPIAVTR